MGFCKGGTTKVGLKQLHLAGEGPSGTSPEAMLAGVRRDFRIRSACFLITLDLQDGMAWCQGDGGFYV